MRYTEIIKAWTIAPVSMNKQRHATSVFLGGGGGHAIAKEEL